MGRPHASTSTHSGKDAQTAQALHDRVAFVEERRMRQAEQNTPGRGVAVVTETAGVRFGG